MGILQGHFSREIAFSAGRRNRIDHECDEIDATKVYEALQVAVQQLPAYLDHVNRFIARLSGE